MLLMARLQETITNYHKYQRDDIFEYRAIESDIFFPYGIIQRAFIES
jgi:hypothetical protein